MLLLKCATDKLTAWSLEKVGRRVWFLSQPVIILKETFYMSWRPGSACRWGHWTFKWSAVSFFESWSLNVTNRKAFFLCMLLDLSLNLDCHAIKKLSHGRHGLRESGDVDGPNAMSVTEQWISPRTHSSYLENRCLGQSSQTWGKTYIGLNRSKRGVGQRAD